VQDVTPDFDGVTAPSYSARMIDARFLPSAADIRDRLTDCLREADLLRQLLRMAERAEYYRECDRRAAERRRRACRGPKNAA